MASSGSRTGRGRQKSIAFAIVFGICLVVLAVTLNVTWVVLNWRTLGWLLLGVFSFLIIITGVILNTIFLVREIKRNEQHDAFINAVTHELKTPIASIRLYLETLQRREVDEDKRQHFYQVMLEDSNRLLHTVEQVLRAGKVGTRQRQLLRTRIVLPQLVQECLELARHRHHLADEAITYRGPAAELSVVVWGDFDELQAAINNLLDNAIKYSGQNVRVAVSVGSLPNGHFTVRVSDQGIGISPEQLKQIFRRFYRIPSSVAMRIKGTGLGLFIVRSVAEKHGGKAYAESAGVGCGSTFTIQLPPAPDLVG